MNQNASQENDKDAKEVRTVEIEQGQTPSLQPSVEKSQVLPTSQSNFGPDMSGSDDDEASEVDSFLLDEGDNDIDDGENVLEPSSKFLLHTESGDAQGLQTVDPETHARLEALLEAAGISKLSSKDGKALTDPEVLRTLTSSVSSALDEAAQALHRMRAEQQNQLAPNECARSLAEACGEGDVNVRKLYDGGNVPEPEEGESLLSLACSAGYYELAQVLLAMKANVEDRGIKGDCTPLMEAASGGHVDIVRLLISHGADVDAQSSAGNTPLHYAACGGYKEVVQELIKANARVEVHNENGHTPLMEAASAGHVEVARILLDNGAGINTHSNEFKESALTLACYKGHLEMVKFLLEAGADQEHKTDEMHTALMEASMDGHVEVARLLLDSGAQVNMPADSFESPLTLAACGGHVELAALLIERGANIEEVNDEGYTPLMEAAREGHDEMVALLLSHDADINAQTEETQETALTLACCGGFLEVADFLIKAGADIELGCSTPLMEAAQEGHLELVKYLLDHNANVHAQTGTGDTALTYACENGHTDVAELLLERGAELEHESEGGRTPLMKAARAGHLCTVNFIIIKGADVNRATTTNDHTVLSLACAGGHLAVVELLLAHGADPGHRLKDGSTMIIEAAKGGHTQVVKLLLEWPNRVLMANSPDLPQINAADSNHEEQHRVPVQGLANIVPPNEPDSQPSPVNFTPNIQGKNPDVIRQNMQKSIAKRCLNGQVAEAKVGKSSNAVIAESLQQLNHDGAMLADLAEDKASEKVEAIINNIMAKELINTTPATKEEQILRKQQILEELQKVERELQEKAQAQLLLSAQQQFEQQQQQVLVQTAAKIKNAAQAKQGERKDDGSSQSQALPEGLGLSGVSSDIQFANDIAAQLPKLLTSADLSVATQSLLPNYPEAFLQPGPQPPNNGASNSITEQRHQVGKPSSQSKRSGNTKGSRTSKNPPSTQSTALSSSSEHNGGEEHGLHICSDATGSQSQEQFQLSAPAQIAMDAVQRQQLQVLAQQQQHQQQLPPHMIQQLPQQQDQLLQQMLQQQNIQQQYVQPLPQHALQQLLPQSSLQQQQLFTQQQQQQFLQQQQQAQQLLHQQLQQQLKQQPPNSNSKQQHVRKQQRVAPNPGEDSAQGNMPILGSPPPSTPMTPNPSPASPQSLTPLYPSVEVDVDAVTESNHDTALTLACAGGHAELVSLLLSKGSDIEHRDKKGFTPLILAATAGHVDVVEILLDHGADIEAQSERTKDTPLSLACSGGRYEVVELLLARGANKEHRNVSDYTPLSLAASGGYVNIIKLLLSHGAEINSRTGSKLGISPLMLAAMNGHTAAVKLLLDMGSDINAQIETNRNTALTLACFQGRHEVVSLLVDRKANIEHRAKTGLTPLMEAASGGYVEVGRVLLERGADVNAPPVPSSRDTALTIAADKGHYRFVELLLHRGAAVDVKNKKGNSPLWLACNGGHLDVVQLLVTSAADIDSQDNRKVSCLMAAFRKGHIKVVKWMVKHVSQFPSDQELQRYIATVTDKELQKKCQQCMEIIVNAKDRQAAEANKNATILLEEIDKERQVEENKKAQAAKKRERRRKKRKEKMEKDKEKDSSSKNSSPEPESVETEDIPLEKEEEEEEEEIPLEPPSATTTSTIGTTLTSNTEPKNSRKNGTLVPSSSAMESRKNKRNKSRQERERETPPESAEPRVPIVTPTIACLVTSIMTTTVTTTTSRVNITLGRQAHAGHHRERDRDREGRRKKNNNPDLMIKSAGSLQFHSPGIGDLDDFGSVPKISEKEIEKLTKTKNNVPQPSPLTSKENLGHHHEKPTAADMSPNTLSLKSTPVIASPKRGQKKEEGWKEVMRKSKKVSVPSNAISRVIGRGGCNINAIREVSGAHVEVEKPKGSGERVITIKGSAEATRQANALIMALVQDPDKELTEILAKNKPKAPSTVTIADFAIGTFNAANLSNSASSTSSGSGSLSTKSPANTSKSSSTRQSSSGVGNNSSSGKSSMSQSMVWQGSGTSQPVPSSPRRSPQKQISSSHSGSPAPNHHSVEKTASRQLFPSDRRSSTSPVVTFTNSSTVSYSSSSTAVKVVPSSANSTRGRPDIRDQVTIKSAPKPVTGPVKLLTRQAQPKPDPQPLPIVASHGTGNNVPNVGQQATPSPGSSTPGEYLPFNNLFSNYGAQILGKKDDSTDKMNFASVAAAGVVSTLSSPLSNVNVASALSGESHKVDPSLQAKAPGYKPGRTGSPQFRQDMEQSKNPGFKNFHLPVQAMQGGMGELDMTRAPGFRGNMPPSGMSPRSNTSTPSGLSPRSQTGTPLDSSQHSISSLSSQKEEYSMPNQPMTLPEIKSTLNPNAPDFQISSTNMNQMVNGLPGGIGQELHPLPPSALQALHQQLLNAQQLLNFSNMPQGNFPIPNELQMLQQLSSVGNQIPNPMGNQMNSQMPNPMSSQMNNQMPNQIPNQIGRDHLSGQMSSNQLGQMGNQMPQGGGQNQPVGPPGPNGQNPGFLPQIISRTLSPMPPPHARPNSAPSMAGMSQGESGSPGPIGPPRGTSPMPIGTPPLPDPVKNNMDDRRVPRPIGGERSHRKAPGTGPGNIGPVGDFSKLWGLNSAISELNSEWAPSTSPMMTSASMQASVRTSSVITGGNMAYTRDGDGSTGEPTQDPNSFPEGLSIEAAVEQNFVNPQMMMAMFPNGVPSNFPIPPMYNPRMSGDGVPTMWPGGMKTPLSEPVENGNNWSQWSQQADM
ncbi:ankyrin repeat domain-containing protein 17-like isoform X5 [Haliotis cracherodii]|uniref:ankyrin repeat domain-containing protein 17-like isoform X5 n=1 Tax=Haliotis cracherodii TaxID=6455 RepID=UPI0039E82DD5